MVEIRQDPAPVDILRGWNPAAGKYHPAVAAAAFRLGAFANGWDRERLIKYGNLRHKALWMRRLTLSSGGFNSQVQHEVVLKRQAAITSVLLETSKSKEHYGMLHAAYPG
ncbi:MAG: hypothetical protein ACYDG7_09990, partial [Thermoleophilia bacterium]